MGNVVANWRAGYTPGDWTVLAGPTALVAIDPDATDLGGALDDLWDDVLASASIADLVSRLAGLSAARVARLAVVFWDSAGLRTLIRGGIVVRDGETGDAVADGEGVLTWREVGLGARRSIVLDLPGGSPGAGERPLPLVVGVVRAGSLRLDAAHEAIVTSAQPMDLDAEGVEADDPGVPPEPVRTEAALPASQTADTELMVLEQTAPEQTAPEEAVPEEAVPEETLAELPAPVDDTPRVSDRPLVPAALCLQGHPNPPYATGCWVCGAAVPSQAPHDVPRPVLGRLRVPDGSTVELDRPVLIGRAPSQSGLTDEEPRLLTVPSPSHDISRSHVLIAPEGWQILVTDLRSTNGTTVVNPGPGVDRVPLQPGQALAVAVGTLVELGDGVAVLIDAAQ